MISWYDQAPKWAGNVHGTMKLGPTRGWPLQVGAPFPFNPAFRQGIPLVPSDILLSHFVPRQELSARRRNVLRTILRDDSLSDVRTK